MLLEGSRFHARAEQLEPVSSDFSDVGLNHMPPVTQYLAEIPNDDDQIAGGNTPIQMAQEQRFFFIQFTHRNLGP